MSCQPYQPLPISTGNVGVDRCGNVHYYAAPKVVYAKVSWPCGQWPVPAQRWPWQPYAQGSGCGCGGSCGSSGALASLLSGGAPLANWMVASRAAKP